MTLEKERIDWAAQPVDRIRERLGAPQPLSAGQAAARLAHHGPNRLPEPRRRGPLQRLMAQLANLLIGVLVAAACITALLGHWLDTGVILAVVVVQTLVGFIQEGKAEQALAAIRHLLAPKATVIRDGDAHRVAAETLVPGDTVLLEAGERVPADLRLERCSSLKIDESLLTGESVAVDKTEAVLDEGLELGDQFNMAFSGTLVTMGTGRGVVVGTGRNTEIGRISGMLETTASLKTPLVEQMDRFARWLSIIIVLAGALVLLVGWRFSGLAITELFMAVVALTVAAIPEGLPAILTVTLAVGVRRMAQRQAVVRRMPVIETLGAVSVICTDKTGTLTRNEMMVARLQTATGAYRVSGEGYGLDGGIHTLEKGPPPDGLVDELALAGALCNDASFHHEEGELRSSGDPMELALKILAHKAQIGLHRLDREWPRLDEIPFDASHRFMATLNHDHHGNHRVLIKGAPEAVLERCSQVLSADGKPLPLEREPWARAVERMAGDGLRVLALARRELGAGFRELSLDQLGNDWTLLGLVGLIDPPREEAIHAIRQCREAGIQVKMITGDHAITAQAVATQLGLEHTDRVLTGKDLDALDDRHLMAQVGDVDVYARTSPEHKLRLVNVIQARHGVVAMTGDGVNDAPALKRADVGVAMGVKGSAAAREAASVVLLDDNFASITAAVHEGRRIYDNLKKTIGFWLPINGGESISLIVALLWGLTLPITALQILWVNMVSSVVLAMPLAFEPAEDDVMKRQPRSRDQGFLAGFVIWRVVLVSFLFLGGIFAAWHWAMARTGDLETARTLAVNTLVAMELFYLFAVRYLDSASLTLRGVMGTPAVLGSIAVLLLVQSAFTYLPLLQETFGTRALGLEELLFAAGMGLAVLLILELETALRRYIATTGNPL